MTKKIFRSIFVVAVSTLLVCLLLILGVLFDYFRGLQTQQLRSELGLAAAGVEAQGAGYLEQLPASGFRLTWVDPDGAVRFDSQNDPLSMENHSQREEIREALLYGAGESSRYSATLTEETLYCAQRLSDGSVLRISVGFATIPALLLGMVQPILIVLILALLLSLGLSSRLSRKIIRPLNDIDLDHPLDNDTYEELAPLLTRMDKQQKKIRRQQAQLLEKQREFCTVIENMAEGLVLLDPQGAVLSINPAAAAFFQADAAAGRDLVELERSPEIGRAVEDARQGRPQSLEVGRGGSVYQLHIDPIVSGGALSGIAMLIFDITQKVHAERSRREFTANVSHELKTPLHSILGSAELLENGLVKPEDQPRFLGHIRTEAARLVSLIEDIIRLSQLDEQAEPEAEPVDLYALAAEEVQALLPAARARQVSLSLEGEPAVLAGVRPLLHEILYNLCDNAIHYNRPGGSVRVTVSQTAAAVRLEVADSGIGIPPEHQERIFERFYRVDKSRSKETGGTGLGLSIVKHAVQYMNGQLHLTSTPGAGTTIAAVFPKQPR